VNEGLAVAVVAVLVRVNTATDFSETGRYSLPIIAVPILLALKVLFLKVRLLLKVRFFLPKLFFLYIITLNKSKPFI